LSFVRYCVKPSPAGAKSNEFVVFKLPGEPYVTTPCCLWWRANVSAVICYFSDVGKDVMAKMMAADHDVSSLCSVRLDVIKSV